MVATVSPLTLKFDYRKRQEQNLQLLIDRRLAAILWRNRSVAATSPRFRTIREARLL
jgi:hypothetical protein